MRVALRRHELLSAVHASLREEYGCYYVGGVTFTWQYVVRFTCYRRLRVSVEEDGRNVTDGCCRRFSVRRCLPASCPPTTHGRSGIYCARTSTIRCRMPGIHGRQAARLGVHGYGTQASAISARRAVLKTPVFTHMPQTRLINKTTKTTRTYARVNEESRVLGYARRGSGNDVTDHHNAMSSHGVSQRVASPREQTHDVVQRTRGARAFVVMKECHRVTNAYRDARSACRHR